MLCNLFDIWMLIFVFNQNLNYGPPYAGTKMFNIVPNSDSFCSAICSISKCLFLYSIRTSIKGHRTPGRKCTISYLIQTVFALQFVRYLDAYFCIQSNLNYGPPYAGTKMFNIVPDSDIFALQLVRYLDADFCI